MIIPADLTETILRVGKVEWGQTPAHDAEGHAAHVADSVRITAEHFAQEGAQHMHGLYIEGTETVVCHTGTSPNSPQIARALTGAWNRLVDEARAASADRSGEADETSTKIEGSAEGESAVPKGDAQ